MKTTGPGAGKRSNSLYWMGATSIVVYVAVLLLLAWYPHIAAEAMPPRLIALAAFTFFALRRRSLTVWIIWGMLAGVELALDAPGIALQSRVFSDIFLRLIKVIVAPLILGTLITGIASHGEMKSVGRLGLKSLIYFEVLTTIALVIGLAAINLSKAGQNLSVSLVGVHVQTRGEVRIDTSRQPEQTLSWQHSC